MGIMFKVTGKKLKKLDENYTKFKVEKDIQKLIENNISTIFPNLSVVKSEYILKGLRMDTLCYNKQFRSFVIIEYKYDKNKSLTDQGLSYLSLLLDNKHEVLLKLNKKIKKNLDVEDVDWESTRTIFISKDFTAYQTNTARLNIVPIDCYRFKSYGDVIELEELEKSSEKISIKNNEKPIKSKHYKRIELTDHDVFKYMNLSDDEIGYVLEIKKSIKEFTFKLYMGQIKIFLEGIEIGAVSFDYPDTTRQVRFLIRDRDRTLIFAFELENIHNKYKNPKKIVPTLNTIDNWEGKHCSPIQSKSDVKKIIQVLRKVQKAEFP
jgi:hypothetical protein